MLPRPHLPLLLAMTSLMTSSQAQTQPPTDPPPADCPPERVSFEMVTGFVYSSPAHMLDSLPGTLRVTDCLDTCRANLTCRAVNYETGLCVLFSSSAEENPDSLTPSDFPVFTLYAQRTCLPEGSGCSRAWASERVEDYALEGFARKTLSVADRAACRDLCLTEDEFVCRSANFEAATGSCALSDMDRHTTAGGGAFQPSPGTSFVANACVDDPVRLCEFERMEGRILKTVDSVFQEVASLDDCKDLCLSAPYRCHSFDYNDTGDRVCRLSHHAAATLSHINAPYLELEDSSTYELSSCYNVTIDCRSGDMVARIKTSKIFNGKIYSKGSPIACVNDVSNSLEFEIAMSYNDVECNVKRDSASRYSSDIVIQHHDTIVTSADLGLSVHCQYDLSNKSVSNRVDLQVTGETQPALEEEAIVDSPNVLMRIADRDGQDIDTAAVGDMLQLRFEIVDKNSPYEILVRDLIALDGSEMNQIGLLDSRGCPEEMSIMRPLVKVDPSGKILGASFDAFKFPTSDVVQFRALVTPCIPFCEPVICDVTDFSGKRQKATSYGRKKREVSTLNARADGSQTIRWLTSKHLDVEGFGVPVTREVTFLARRKRATEEIPEEHLVVQTIRILDKFGFKGKKAKKTEAGSADETLTGSENLLLGEEQVVVSTSPRPCLNSSSLALGCSLFLLAQLVLAAIWAACWQRRRNSKLPEPLAAPTTETLRQLYDSGYPRRH